MRSSHGNHTVLIAATVLATIAVITPPARADRPHRIVSAFLCTDEYVLRLVPRNRIAAVSYLAADTHPVVSTVAEQAKGIPGVRASAEQVLALHPDLVVTYAGTNARQTQLLRAANIHVLEIPWAQSLTDVRRITLMLGRQLGAEPRGAAMLREMDVQLRAARFIAAHPPVRTLIYEPNGYATSGGVTDEILSAAGLQNVATGPHLTRSGSLPVESVLTTAPELLVLNGEHEAQPAKADLVLKHPALRALHGNTLIARASLVPLLCPGPWSAGIAGTLATLGRQASAVEGNHTAK